MLAALDSRADRILRRIGRPMGYLRYWLSGANTDLVKRVAMQADVLVDYLSDSRDARVVQKLSSYPIVTSLWLYRPAPRRWMAWTGIILIPVGIPVWLLGNIALRRLRTEMKTILSLDAQLLPLLSPEMTVEPTPTDHTDTPADTHD